VQRARTRPRPTTWLAIALAVFVAAELTLLVRNQLRSSGEQETDAPVATHAVEAMPGAAEAAREKPQDVAPQQPAPTPEADAPASAPPAELARVPEPAAPRPEPPRPSAVRVPEPAAPPPEPAGKPAQRKPAEARQGVDEKALRLRALGVYRGGADPCGAASVLQPAMAAKPTRETSDLYREMMRECRG
jgi:hypothetical protein